MYCSRKSASILVFALCALAAAGLAARAALLDETETSFLGESRMAMNRMMTAMKIRPTGDVDRDFASTMIPHHQGAIEMARSELRFGHNEQLRRIAQEIIVDQQQEIVAMRVALRQRGSNPMVSIEGRQ